jgi:hypothetical protein
MNTQERVQQIMASEELTSIEKRDQLRALIPAEVFKIDSMSRFLKIAKRFDGPQRMKPKRMKPKPRRKMLLTGNFDHQIVGI